MRLTNDEELDGLLWDLLGRMREALGGKLVGLYLCGSLAAGDFDRGSTAEFMRLVIERIAGRGAG